MTNNSSSKIFKNLDEQIQILLDKGLIIDDIEKTKVILLRENYFFISGYRHLFMKSKKRNQFIEGTTFEDLPDRSGKIKIDIDELSRKIANGDNEGI